MKLIILILAILFIPVLTHAQSMVEISNNDTVLEMENNSPANVNSQETEEEKEVTTINININLPDVKLLPSSPLYFLKKTWETVKGWFIFNTENKIKYGLDLANQRLEETEKLILNKKTDLVDESLNRFNEQMAKVNSNIEKAEKKGKDLTGIYNLIQQNKEKHQTVLNQLQAQLPDSLQDIITNVKDVSQKGFQLSKEKINQGMDILENKPQ
ncbi:MAG: hypothetical protein COT24_04205 [Candidatus Kerfeldbacteria bacterium CG08_land_8_20_14_0_20_40_16]|uniref:DUF5667 domain-containing protein n=1 Tax=Candidatus Kerfeldbacteria bacterium CG08_land_8_20_14_0_20_40_16 TaxID=2014244 RepID=A0A2H0YUS8_9BACT|nr:MAG: hypothetical protein COT24_04205 [Candidatus Kerfeldbacteria bacterium CG08_land_8_20_14_0_20_40_16]